MPVQGGIRSVSRAGGRRRPGHPGHAPDKDGRPCLNFDGPFWTPGNWPDLISDVSNGMIQIFRMADGSCCAPRPKFDASLGCPVSPVPPTRQTPDAAPSNRGIAQSHTTLTTRLFRGSAPTLGLGWRCASVESSQVLRKHTIVAPACHRECVPGRHGPICLATSPSTGALDGLVPLAIVISDRQIPAAT